MMAVPLGYRRGFSFIELMVVIAIIAIFIASMLSMSIRARQKAEMNACLINQRSCGMAMEMYIRDHDDTFPFSIYEAPPESSKCIMSLASCVLPYLKSKEAFVCPSELQPFDIDVTVQLIWGSHMKECSGVKHISYMWNFNLFPMGKVTHPSFNSAKTERAVKLSEISFPTETVMNYDGDFVLLNCMIGNCRLDCRDNKVFAGYDGADPAIQARHNGFLSANFVDGHSKSIGAKEADCRYEVITGWSVIGQTPEVQVREGWCLVKGPYTRECESDNCQQCVYKFEAVIDKDGRGNCYKVLSR